MKRVVQFVVLVMLFPVLHAQSVATKLAAAVKVLEADDQLKSGLVGLYVMDQQTGKVVFAENGKTGFAAASSQKVITSVAAFELLGKDYRYTTTIGYSGNIENGTLNGNIYLLGSGDPSLGSWRYESTKEAVVFNEFTSAIKAAGIKTVNGNVIAYNANWPTQTIPGGWIWDDIGNYYGAGATVLNWHENQYDIQLQSSNTTGDPVKLLGTSPALVGVTLTNEITVGKPGSGDNGYIYLPPYSTTGFIRGTIPPGQKSFIISGSFPDPLKQIAFLFTAELTRQGIAVNSTSNTDQNVLPAIKNLATHTSPALDSLTYWFLKKSINLYGEAFVKTLGLVKQNQPTTEAGVTVIKQFWNQNGLDTTAINMVDGSGLSPTNRITPQALATVMKYAKSRSWFQAFYNALPEINGLKMKSGTIGGAKSFTGYAGNYTFAIIINNYNGATSEVVKKMYRILDILK